MLSFGLILNPQPNRSWNDHTESITQTPWCNAVAPVTSFAIMFEPYADNRRRVETLLSAAAYYMESSRPDRAPQHSIFSSPTRSLLGPINLRLSVGCYG